MAGRKPVRPAWDPLRGDLETTPELNPQAQALFDDARRKEEKRHFSRPLELARIVPDPRQPRRSLPNSVRTGWDGGSDRLPALFDDWRRRAEAERGGAIDLAAYVLAEGDAGERDLTTLGPLESGLLALADLAADIRRNGLLNPITVVRAGDWFQIETGERRWLAHHLLRAVTKDSSWGIISARVVDQASVWRQAGENSARASLNAISKARQFALLLMDLYSQPDSGTPYRFKAYDACVPRGACDRAFYAQVADSDRFRIPQGKGELLLNAMGLKGRASFSRFRALLHLPDEIWQMGDDFNWSDDRLYLLATMPPEQAIQRAREMRRRDEAKRARRLVLSQNKLADAPRPSHESHSMQAGLETSEFKRRTLRIARMVDRIGRLSDPRRGEALDEIAAVRRWLDEAERLFRDQPPA